MRLNVECVWPWNASECEIRLIVECVVQLLGGAKIEKVETLTMFENKMGKNKNFD